jgi:hypothetical protein
MGEVVRKILSLRTAAFTSPLSLSFSNLLVRFAPLIRCSFCILHVYLRVPYAFNEIDLLLIYKKKKKMKVLFTLPSSNDLYT